MPTKIWRGDAQAVIQESRATPANVEIGDVFTLIVNQKEISYTATAATVANVTAGLVAAWALSTEPEHTELTVTDETTYVKIVGAAGVPFTVTSSATDGGGANTQTLTMSTPTAATGPHHWDNADNWSPAGVPANGDDVILERSNVGIYYGFAQSAVTLASLKQYATFTGDLGLPAWNALGYFEYRATELAIGATAIELGIGGGNGSQLMRLNTGTAQTSAIVRSTGSSSEDGVPSVCWRGTHAANAVNVIKGSVGIAAVQGQAATVDVLRVGYESNTRGDAVVVVGAGVTLGDVYQTGSLLNVKCAADSLDLTEGEYIQEAGALTTLTADGGVVRYRSPGTITTAIVGGGAELDLSQGTQAVTITNIELHAGAIFRDPGGRGTYTNGFDLVRCSPSDITWEMAPHQTYTLSAI